MDGEILATPCLSEVGTIISLFLKMGLIRIGNGGIGIVGIPNKKELQFSL